MSLLLLRPDYEQWLYAIPAAYPSVQASTLHFFTTERVHGGHCWQHPLSHRA